MLRFSISQNYWNDRTHLGIRNMKEWRIQASKRFAVWVWGFFLCVCFWIPERRGEWRSASPAVRRGGEGTYVDSRNRPTSRWLDELLGPNLEARPLPLVSVVHNIQSQRRFHHSWPAEGSGGAGPGYTDWAPGREAAARWNFAGPRSRQQSCHNCWGSRDSRDDQYGV